MDCFGNSAAFETILKTISLDLVKSRHFCIKSYIFEIWDRSVTALLSLVVFDGACTAIILTVLSIAFGSITCATVIWLHILQPKIPIALKLYSSVSLNVMCTVVARNNHCQIKVAHVTQTMTVNWL